MVYGEALRAVGWGGAICPGDGSVGSRERERGRGDERRVWSAAMKRERASGEGGKERAIEGGKEARSWGRESHRSWCTALVLAMRRGQHAHHGERQGGKEEGTPAGGEVRGRVRAGGS